MDGGFRGGKRILVNRLPNFDPLERRVRVVALALSELVGVAETRERGFGCDRQLGF
jgi:hypothetical protein